MKELTNHEIQAVSGGITVMGIAFVLSIISGAKGFSEKQTIINTTLLGAVVGAVYTGPLFFIGMPIGAVIGAVDGFIGYTLGSFLQDN